MRETPLLVEAKGEDDGASTIFVRGELDYGSAPILRDLMNDLIDKGSRRIVLDFSEVSFMDSEGLKVLLHAHGRIGDLGGAISVCGCQRSVARVFETLGLQYLFLITTSECSCDRS